MSGRKVESTVVELTVRETTADSRAEVEQQDEDDDFGFEEYKNVKLIKVPLKDEATEKSDA